LYSYILEKKRIRQNDLQKSAPKWFAAETNSESHHCSTL